MESGHSKATAALVVSFILIGIAAILAVVGEDTAAVVTVAVSAVLLIGFFVYMLQLQQQWKHSPDHTYGDLVFPTTPQSRQTHVPL